MGGRIKAGIIEKRELQADYEKGSLDLGDEQVTHIHWDAEIRVSLRSSRFPSIELFTLRNVKPDDYQLILVAAPRQR